MGRGRGDRWKTLPMRMSLNTSIKWDDDDDDYAH